MIKRLLKLFRKQKQILQDEWVAITVGHTPIPLTVAQGYKCRDCGLIRPHGVCVCKRGETL